MGGAREAAAVADHDRAVRESAGDESPGSNGFGPVSAIGRGLPTP